MDEKNGEKIRLLAFEDIKVTKHPIEIRVYRRRWWVAFMLTFASLLSGMNWNTLGIIADSAKHLFGWTDSDIGIIININNITFIAAVIPLCMLMDSNGLKISVIICGLLMFIGSTIRCFSLDPQVFFATCCLNAGLTGIAAVIPLAGPAKIAAVWFPRHERSLVTGIIAFCIYIGSSLAFLIGPLLVPAPVYRESSGRNTSYNSYLNIGNDSDILLNSTAEIIKLHRADYVKEVANFKEMEQGMLHLMILFAALTTLFLVFTLIYFPAKPPTPPSFSASIARTDYRRAIIDILKNKEHWIIVLAASLPRGITISWAGVLGVPAARIGLSQVTAGMIAFCSTIIGAASGLVFSRVSYLLGGRSKMLVLFLSVTGTLFSTWTAVLFTKRIETHIPSLYISCIVVGIITYGTVPLFYEMSAEAAFPVGEGVAGGLYTLVLHLVSIIYFAGMSIPNIGVDWMTWAIVCASAFSVPLLALFNERNKRSDLDKAFVSV